MLKDAFFTVYTKFKLHFYQNLTPNPAYKVNSLVEKGYIRKIQSQRDRREYHLEVTQKYIDYYNISISYMSQVMDRILERFSPEECAKLEEMLEIISRELMPEIELPGARRDRE